MLNKIVSETSPAVAAAKGFGSSDCRCVTHLWRYEVPPGRNTEGWFFDTEEFLASVKQKPTEFKTGYLHKSNRKNMLIYILTNFMNNPGKIFWKRR